MAGARREAVGASGRVRAFVWGFLALFTGFGLTGVDAWPFSGFHLFSHVRTDRFLVWEITAVDAAGDERPVYADRQTVHLVSRLSKLTEGERLAACRVWAPPDSVEVRVYATVDSVQHPGTGLRELRYACRA